MEGVGLENEEDITNGESDEKSIVAARESGCCSVTPSFCMKAERTDGGRASDAAVVVVVDLAASSDACVCVNNVCGPLGVGVPLSVYVTELFAGVDVRDCDCEGGASLVGDATVVGGSGGGDEEMTTARGDDTTDAVFAAS